MYEEYITLLRDEFSFDFREAESTFGQLGNAPGIYPDVAYLLFRLCHHEKLNSLFETGSGFSSLVFALSSSRTRKKFVAIESLDKWLKTTRGLLESFSLDTDCILFSDCTKESPNANDVRDYTFSKTRNVIDLDFEPDWVWIDGMAMGPDVFEGWNLPYNEVRIMTCEYYADKIRNSLLVFDDINTPFGEELPRWLLSQGRKLDYTFNPLGRSDRHVGFSFPAPDPDLLELIKDCEVT